MGSDYDHKVGILESAIDEVLELVTVYNALGLVQNSYVYLQEVHRLTDRLHVLFEEDQ